MQEDAIGRAIAAWRRGERDIASREAQQAWDNHADFRAATLLALVEMDGGRLDRALTWTLLAAARNPGEPRLLLQASQLHFQLGQQDEYLKILEQAVHLHPGFGPAWLAFGKALAKCGETARASSLLRAALKFPLQRAEALQILIDITPIDDDRTSPVELVPEVQRQGLSIVICSIDDKRYDRARSSYSESLIDWPHEFVRISDARSLTDGYSRGMLAAQQPLIVFSHDDVEIINPHLGHRITRYLAQCDILGVAGAERAAGASWVHAGHPFLHGCVILPHQSGYEINIYSERAPFVSGIQVLDGVFLATRRSIALELGWDTNTFDRFHAYDIDFTLRAAKAKYRLAVATDLGLLHYSRGNYGEIWARESRKLLAKHPELGDLTSITVTGFGRRLPDRRSVCSFLAHWTKGI